LGKNGKKPIKMAKATVRKIFLRFIFPRIKYNIKRIGRTKYHQVYIDDGKPARYFQSVGAKSSPLSPSGFSGIS
jgi:hypothetical protein